MLPWLSALAPSFPHGWRRRGSVESASPTARVARPPPSSVGYVALTKPRIIELLLITTVPTMVLAERGWPSWSLVAITLVGRHVGRRRCQCDQHGHRPRHRQADAANAGPAPGHRPDPAPRRADLRAGARGVGIRCAVGRRQPALGRARSVGDVVLRLRLLVVAEAHQHPEHRHRRCSGRGARAGWMGRGAKRRHVGPRRVVRRHVPVDTAALLGTRHPLRRRLPRGERADVAGGRDRGGHGPEDGAATPC